MRFTNQTIWGVQKFGRVMMMVEWLFQVYKINLMEVSKYTQDILNN